MILFNSDFDKYPSAIVDHTTKNESFIEISALYREMGIKNHLFPLTLLNPKLKGVDPFDPDLSYDYILMIALECKRNFWYFIREIARDPAGSDEYPLRIKANRGLIGMYWMFFAGVMVYLILIRQTGKSFGLDWLWTYLANCALTKTDISLITLTEKLRTRQVERLKGMELVMPPYLRRRLPTDAANTEIIRISSLMNTIKLYLSNRSPKMADVIGRGMTSPVDGFDEWCYLPNNEIITGVMLSASQAARELSVLKNEPAGVIFASTSGKRDTPEGKYSYKLVNDAADFNDRLFDSKDKGELHDRIRASSKNRDRVAINITMNHRQLGHDDDWLRARIANSTITDPVQIAADYFNEWPKGGHSDVFTQKDLTRMRDSQIDTPYLSFTSKERGNYTLRWYIDIKDIAPYLARHKHILSIDPSEAIGSDAIGVTLVNVETGGVTMAADIDISFITSFCLWLGEFMKDHDVLLQVERKSTGLVVLELIILVLLEKGINPFTRIFNLIVHEAEEKKERFQEMNKRWRDKGYLLHNKGLFGFNTSGSGVFSRAVLYDRILRKAVKNSGNVMHDRKLIDQASNLEIINYRIDHRDGEHDDLVIAWVIAHWTMMEGNNLRYYGLDPSIVLSKSEEAMVERNEFSYYDRSAQEQAKTAIEKLVAQLEIETDEYAAYVIERKIQRETVKLSREDQDIFARDDLVNKLREDRLRRFKTASAYENFSSYS